MESIEPSGGFRHWFRVLRPLFWWTVVVLLMLGWRTHERLSARTTINLIPMLNGLSVSSQATWSLDGNPAGPGLSVPIGWHTLTITHPKTKPFSTNLFIWYGPHNLGSLRLERTMGTLIVRARPPARLLTIHGPEFSASLTNSPGMTSSVPADRYVIEARYRFWEKQQEVTVLPDQSTSWNCVPKLGALHIEANRADASFQLLNDAGKVWDSGALPAMIPALPEGNYQIVAERNGGRKTLPATVRNGGTNELKVEFVYGAALLDTDPPGARVISGGREYGTTPLVLPELPAGAFEFELQREGFATVTTSLTIAANQTNHFQTNLVSRLYVDAMTSGRRLFENHDYVQAERAATDALKQRPDDPEAMKVEREAGGMAHLDLARRMAQQGDFASGITEAKAALSELPDNGTAKELLGEYTRRVQQLGAEEKKRNELERARQERQRKIDHLDKVLDGLSRDYENGLTFARNELTVTNQGSPLSPAITNALAGGNPAFKILVGGSQDADLFIVKARQGISIGYREALIVGGQVAQNEAKIVYRVIESENPPKENLLGGFLRFTSKVTTATDNPHEAWQRAERFKTRVKEGIQIVKERIEKATGR